MPKKNFKKIFLAAARFRFLLILPCFAAGVFVGVLIQKYRTPATQAAHTVRAVTEPGGLQGDYKFINPLLFLETPDATSVAVVTPLHDEMQAFINDAINKKEADGVSIYFRDSNTGWWFVINGDEQYAPASLVKVPLMITIFKLAESDPSMLTRQLTYDGSFDENKAEHFPPAQSIVAGRTYTVEELLRFMIVYSDNNAYRLLVNNIDPNSLTEVYRDLGIPVPTSANIIDFMTVKSYSYFFRILYNSTYLTNAYSEEAMQLLAGVDFPQGIVSQIPSSVPVANKFGERSFTDIATGKTTDELHDCGYVYYPNRRPYLICIMTKGGSFDTLVSVIQNISRMSYAWMQQEYK